MKELDRRHALKVLATAVGLTSVSPSAAMAEAPEKHGKGEANSMNFQIPASLKAEHDELHEELIGATRAGGKTGETAHAVAKILHPHFVKEEELAMPPLGLLPTLADNRVTPQMAPIVDLTNKLKTELPAMLKEHEAIGAALDALKEAAQRENKLQARRFAEKLKQHAKMEEEVLYPAAVLIGEYIKLKLKHDGD